MKDRKGFMKMSIDADKLMGCSKGELFRAFKFSLSAVAVIALVLVILFAGSGCSGTLMGAGGDLKSMGQGIELVASKHKQKKDVRFVANELKLLRLQLKTKQDLAGMLLGGGGGVEFVDHSGR